METCSSVDEVIAVFDDYNLQSLDNAMLMFVDRTGDAVIIEGDEYIRKKGDFQIVMNFYHSEVMEGTTETCVRYNNIMSQIPESDVSVDSFKRMLAAVHQEGAYPTQYSNIFDPDALLLYLYHFHNYENEVIINVSEELVKGEHFFDIPALFPETYAYERFIEESGSTFAKKISEIIDTEGITAAERSKQDIRERKTSIYRYPLDENEMNDLGYQYLLTGEVEKAIAVFKMNVEYFPESWNCYDSLGEAYLEAGDYVKARENYSRSLELNPDNLHGQEILE
jgi:tetratricopeptide (TPR) repeat protein